MARRWELAAIGAAAIGAGVGLSVLLHPTRGRRRLHRVIELTSRGAGAVADEGRRVAARVRLSRVRPHDDPYEHLEDYAEPANIVHFDTASRRSRIALLAAACGGLALGSLIGGLAQWAERRLREEKSDNRTAASAS